MVNFLPRVVYAATQYSGCQIRSLTFSFFFNQPNNEPSSKEILSPVFYDLWGYPIPWTNPEWNDQKRKELVQSTLRMKQQKEKALQTQTVSEYGYLYTNLNHSQFRGRSSLLTNILNKVPPIGKGRSPWPESHVDLIQFKFLHDFFSVLFLDLYQSFSTLWPLATTLSGRLKIS